MFQYIFILVLHNINSADLGFVMIFTGNENQPDFIDFPKTFNKCISDLIYDDLTIVIRLRLEIKKKNVKNKANKDFCFLLMFQKLLQISKIKQSLNSHTNIYKFNFKVTIGLRTGDMAFARLKQFALTQKNLYIIGSAKISRNT